MLEAVSSHASCALLIALKRLNQHFRGQFPIAPP
jgi:hypothetical protein